MNDWIYALSIVIVEHVVEDNISPSGSIFKEPNPSDTHGVAKWKEDHKFIYTL